MCVCVGFFLAFVAEQQPKSEHTKDKVAQILHHSSVGEVKGEGGSVGAWHSLLVSYLRDVHASRP